MTADSPKPNKPKSTYPTTLNIYMGTHDQAVRRLEALDRIARQLGYAAPNGGLRGRSALIQAICDGDVTLTLDRRG